MAAHKKPGSALTLEQYASVYRCTVSTVAGWRAQGAPLDAPATLISWLLRRRGNQPLPRGLRAQLRFGKGAAGIVADFDRVTAHR